MKITAIYDNGGKTLDRYTVVTDEAEPSSLNRWWNMLGLNEGGAGFSQWTEGQYNPGGNNRHLGKRVHFEELSADTQSHIAYRIFTEGN